MANMMMANNTNSPIWSNGAIALMMDFNTTCRPAEREGKSKKKKTRGLRLVQRTRKIRFFKKKFFFIYSISLWFNYGFPWRVRHGTSCIVHHHSHGVVAQECGHRRDMSARIYPESGAYWDETVKKKIHFFNVWSLSVVLLLLFFFCFFNRFLRSSFVPRTPCNILTWNAGDQFERPQHPDRSQRPQVHVCRWRYLCYTSVATTLLITTQCATYPKINTQSVLFI